MLKIIIETVDHNSQRYPSCGDFFYRGSDNTLEIKVSKLSNWRFEFLVALHELVEAMWCRAEGVGYGTVDAFDLAHPTTPDYEPGDDTDAPYYQGHQIASAIERLMAAELFVDWREYEAEVDNLFKEKAKGEKSDGKLSKSS